MPADTQRVGGGHDFTNGSDDHTLRVDAGTLLTLIAPSIDTDRGVSPANITVLHPYEYAE